MGRENHDSTMVHSSIALLQERFRQLQRVKEMREEKELKKLFTEVPKHFNSNSNNNTLPSTCESTRLFSHPELINISSSKSSSLSPPHISLSLWPTSQDFTSFKKPFTTNYTQSLQTSWKSSYDCDSSSDSGVDTSLHL